MCNRAVVAKGAFVIQVHLPDTKPRSGPLYLIATDPAQAGRVEIATMQPLLTEKQVALILQIAPSTLRNWRNPKIKKGPAWAKYGRLVRYDRKDVQLWMDQTAVRSEADQFGRG
jgi:predicted DNA-binding transcriptional regulator AlpA